MSRNIGKNNNISEPFICENCGSCVAPAASGTMNRNHCPVCLWSRHVDLRIGDRLSVCRGLMEPAGLWVKEKGEWALIHRCTKCGFLRSNRIAPDDSQQVLLGLAIRPLRLLPFPVDFMQGKGGAFGHEGGSL